MSQLQEGIAKEHPEWILPRVCQQNAYKTGIYTGICLGILSVPIARRVGLDKNRIMLAAMSTAVLTGYLVSRYTYKGCISSEGFLSAMRHIDTSPTDKPNNDSELH